VRRGTVLLKDEELACDLNQSITTETVVTASRYDSRLSLVNLDFVIDKYQTSVLSTTCGSPTDAISD